MQLTFPMPSAPPSRASTNSTGGMNASCEFLSRPTQTAPPSTRKCGYLARPRNIFRAAQRLTDGTLSGDHGSWMTSAHTRNCTLPATPGTVPSTTGKTRMRFLFALRSPRWGNVLEALTSRCCLLGAYHESIRRRHVLCTSRSDLIWCSQRIHSTRRHV
jgi:hypothetical protein